MKKRTLTTCPRGFTLAETVIAIGIVGVLIAVFMAMFLPAKRTVQQALTSQEADRLTRSFCAELSIVRPEEQITEAATESRLGFYRSAFDKAFFWMMETNRPATAVVVYNYRADTSKTKRKDGSYTPYKALQSIPGQNNLLVSTAALLNNPIRKDDLKFAVGPIFLVRMTQLVWDEGSTRYVLAKKPGMISNPYSKGQNITNPTSYVYDPASSKSTPPWGAEVLYQADFFLLNSPNPSSFKKLTWEKLQRPIFSRNLAFRR